MDQPHQENGSLKREKTEGEFARRLIGPRPDDIAIGRAQEPSERDVYHYVRDIMRQWGESPWHRGKDGIYLIAALPQDTLRQSPRELESRNAIAEEIANTPHQEVAALAMLKKRSQQLDHPRVVNVLHRALEDGVSLRSLPRVDDVRLRPDSFINKETGANQDGLLFMLPSSAMIERERLEDLRQMMVGDSPAAQDFRKLVRMAMALYQPEKPAATYRS